VWVAAWARRESSSVYNIDFTNHEDAEARRFCF
jgi:hypothetical protein